LPHRLSRSEQIGGATIFVVVTREYFHDEIDALAAQRTFKLVRNLWTRQASLKPRSNARVADGGIESA